MRKYTLICREDRESGELGFMFEDTKVIEYPMVARQGMLLAHDLLEHPNGLKSIGSIDDELEALGSSWYCRGQFDDFNRNSRFNGGDPQRAVASDIVNLGSICLGRGVKFKTEVPKTRYSSFDVDFEEIINLAKLELSDELENDFVEIENYDQKFDAYFDAVIHYMRNGLRKARKRFPIADEMNALFWEVATACNSWVRHPDFEGQKLTLRVDKSTLQAYCEECYDDYY